MARYRNRYRTYQTSPRFPDYREITAKFDSVSTDCGSKEGGHQIKKGDLIGIAWMRGKTHTHCAACWHAWRAENRAADEYEASGYMGAGPCW
jgi:hypothetical protein